MQRPPSESRSDGGVVAHRKVALMNALIARWRQLVAEPDGQDLIEYALLVGLISVVAIVGVTSLGNAVDQILWNMVSTGLANAL
jgi:Flp pilus assembly pilin Flp